ncbi:MAG: hypothetical protein ACRDPF_12925 [Streptosporangiaceae bacterium]
MNDSVVAIVSAFFIIGISVGVIAVIALSVIRARRASGPGDGPGDPGDQPEHYPPPPEPGWHGSGAEGQPSWPGDSAADFRGR